MAMHTALLRKALQHRADMEAMARRVLDEVAPRMPFSVPDKTLQAIVDHFGGGMFSERRVVIEARGLAFELMAGVAGNDRRYRLFLVSSRAKTVGRTLHENANGRVSTWSMDHVGCLVECLQMMTLV